MLTSEPVDLILTDIAMPSMSGLDMLKRIRQIPRFAHLPVIVCSAMKTREYVVMAAQLRVHSFVVKPVDRQYLLECITAALQDHET
jgi:putative two-component system response regulator